VPARQVVGRLDPARAREAVEREVDVDARALGVPATVDDRGAVQRQRVEQPERQRQRGAAGELREQGVEGGVGGRVVGGFDPETGRTDRRGLAVGGVGREVGGDAEGDASLSTFDN